MELRKTNLKDKVNLMVQKQQPKKDQPKWSYYFIDTTDMYVKTIINTSKAGNQYNSYYFYKAKKDGTVILKFSTPAWNCFYVWEDENRYVLLRVDKSDTNENTINMVQQLESMSAMDYVGKFEGDYVFTMLVDEEENYD